MHPDFDYKSILESISGGFLALNKDFIITYWNNAAEEGTRLKSEEVLGKHIFEIFPNAKGAPLGETYKLAMETQTFQSIETAYKDDKFESWYDIRMYPAATGLSVFFQDITRRKQDQRQREIIAEISHVINTSRHLDELCVSAAEQIAKIFEIPPRLISVFLFDHHNNEIRLVAPALLDIDFAADTVHQRVDAGAPRLAARVARSKAQVVTDDLSLSTAGNTLRGEFEHQQIKTLIVMPLMVQGELQGVVEAVTMKDKGYVTSEVELLTLVANELAGGMSRKRLIDEIRQKNVELEEQTLKTQEASETLKKFLAMFSHELRSPLNSIIGFSDLLASQLEELPQSSVEEFMKNINASGKHLQLIINDILDLSKIESGTLDLHIASYPVSYFEESIRRVLSASIQERQINLEFAFSPEFDEIVVDQTRFKQILINLVSNAIKFSDPGGTVRISSRREGNDIQFEVLDHGIGIKAADVTHLFKPFKQAADGKGMNRNGIGLGLVITKKLIELHGGTIWIDSAWGEGSTVSFRIPLVIDVSTELGKQGEMLLEVLKRENKPLRDEERPLALIVEDSLQAAELMKMHIESAGYRVVIAKDGAEAVEMAKELRPTVITLDLMLPVKDGWQVMKELKRHPLCKHIPIVIVSIIDEKNLGFGLGAVDYFVKPVNRDDLIKALDRVHIIRKPGERPPTVLAIDDDKSATDLIQLILESEGYRVLKANDGKHGVEIAVREHPDLIILDIVMPEMSGFDVAQELKQIPASRDIPIIILTSMDIDETEQAELSEFVSGLMKKGAFTKRDLLREIAHIGPEK
ncbi:MAG TPA: response regulator [Bacteroidota bacterium]